MGTFDRGVQMLLSTVGAFAAFSLMTIAVGTDYWLYSRGVCKIKTTNENETSKKNEEVMTHSGLWRTCCLEGKKLDSSLFLSLSCLVAVDGRLQHGGESGTHWIDKSSLRTLVLSECSYL
ncbi:voltage-dependent calcium channel gamma-2 subunit-like [Tachysurus ichikawai]